MQLRSGLKQEIRVSIVAAIFVVLVGVDTGAVGTRQVSILDYGGSPARADIQTAKMNAAAFTEAFAASPDVVCPAGAPFHVTPVIIPHGAKRLSGGCTIIADPSTPSGAAVLSASDGTNLEINDITANADIGNLPNVAGFHFARERGLRLINVQANAAFGIVDNDSTGTTMIAPRISDFGVRGIYVTRDRDLRIVRADVATEQPKTSHCISVAEGGHVMVADSAVASCGGFGYSFEGSPAHPLRDVIVQGNHATGTNIEGMNFTDVTTGKATNNVLVFNATSTDFGASFAGGDTSDIRDGRKIGVTTAIEFSHNLVQGSCKAGIALASNINHVNIHDNTLEDVGACLGWFGADRVHSEAAILLYGPAVQNNVVNHNLVIDSYKPHHIAWQVEELDDGGRPNTNHLARGGGFIGVRGIIKVLPLSMTASLAHTWTTQADVHAKSYDVPRHVHARRCHPETKLLPLPLCTYHRG